MAMMVDPPNGMGNHGKHYFTMWQTLFEIDTKYVPIKPIGRGAYGIVCSSINRETNEKVAIKKINSVFDNRVDALRTLRELKLLRHLRHENVIALKDIMMPPYRRSFKDVYLVYELMDTDMHQIIKSPQPLSDDHCQYFLFQILKPGNLLVNANCDLKICDFGLARTNSTKTGQFMTEYVVTRWYRAPELLLCCDEYGTSIDVWSVGCIFAELLGRKPIFPGHGENRPSNDSYCDAKKGESRKAERNDASIAVCEAEYIKEAPLCLEKAKDIFRKKSRHDSESPEIPEGPAKKKAKNDDANKKVVRKDGDIIKKDGSLLEVTQTIDTVVLTEKKKKQRDRTKKKGPCSDLPSEVKHKPQVEDRNQVHPDIDTDNQPVVCFAGPTEVVNTSLKKKKCKRNASSEDPTTLRLTPTQSRKGGEEEFQVTGHGENKQLNDSYCDAKKGKSRKAETNEAEYIKEAPLFLAKEKDISGNNSRLDSESPEIIKHKPQVEEDRNQVSLSHKEKTEKPGEKDTWSGSHEGGNTKKKREGDKKDIMSSCHEYNPKEAAITEMAAEVQLEAASSTYSNNVVLCKELLPPCKKNLLVLDINGILVDITSDYNYQQYPDFKLSGKLGFKRPFCVDFLKFCFANFEVGVWSSRKQYNLVEAVHHLFGEMKNKLLFCWDQSKCTDTKFETVEKKPLFFKELNKLWEKVEANLPWEKGRFTPSNTLLVDDSPCKALRNPPYTAIFPYPYTFYNKEDNSLGRGGEMRIYLEKVAAVENIPEFVKENPFGQSAITPHKHPQWNYYYSILEALKRLTPAF